MRTIALFTIILSMVFTAPTVTHASTALSCSSPTNGPASIGSTDETENLYHMLLCISYVRPDQVHNVTFWSSFADDLGFDELDMFELYDKIQYEFMIQFSFEWRDTFWMNITVYKLISLLELYGFPISAGSTIETESLYLIFLCISYVRPDQILNVTLWSSFADDLGFDELDMYELYYHIQEEFQIEFPFDWPISFWMNITVYNLINLLELYGF